MTWQAMALASLTDPEAEGNRPLDLEGWWKKGGWRIEDIRIDPRGFHVPFETVWRDVRNHCHEQRGRIRAARDRDDAQVAEQLVTRLTGEDQVQRFVHLAAELFRLAAGLVAFADRLEEFTG